MTPTNSLTAGIMNFIRAKGGYAVRIQVQGQWIMDKKGGRWGKSHTEKGTADIHACINGRHVSIEVKIGRDKQSPEQKMTQERVEKAGGLYIVARSIDEFMTWYNNIRNL